MAGDRVWFDGRWGIIHRVIGDFANVQFADGTRGWMIPLDNLDWGN